MLMSKRTSPASAALNPALFSSDTPTAALDMSRSSDQASASSGPPTRPPGSWWKFWSVVKYADSQVQSDTSSGGQDAACVAVSINSP
jgi:hypothetical protein